MEGIQGKTCRGAVMSRQNDALFRAENICRSFHSGTEKIRILKGVSLAINRGEMLAVVGASGSGKTTLLQILGTLDLPDSGSLYFNNTPLDLQNDNTLSGFRNSSVGFIFQFHHLLPEFTALENVMMPGLIAGKKSSEMEQPAKQLLKQVELDHRYHHRVAELSGGEQQRTALARALVMKPALLLADEPTGNLDTRSGNMVFTLIQDLCRELSLATIMVTHNTELAGQMDSTVTLQDGTLQ